MSLGEVRDLISMATGCLGIFAFFYAYFAKRSAATSTELKATHERVDKLEDRLLKIETELQHVPDTNAIHEMQIGMMDLKAQMAVLAEKLKPIGAMAERMQNHLLDQAKTK